MSERTTVEYETIDSNNLIPSNTNSFDQVLLVAKRTQCRKKPAITIEPLADITCSRTFVEEHWLVKNILDLY